MLDSNVLPMTEEVVSKSEMSKPANTVRDREENLRTPAGEGVLEVHLHSDPGPYGRQ